MLGTYPLTQYSMIRELLIMYWDRQSLMQQNTVFGHDTKDAAPVKNVPPKKYIQFILTGITFGLDV